MTFSNRSKKAPQRALIARARSLVTVIEASGRMIAWDVDQLGADANDLGIEDPPGDGLWVWRGVYRWVPPGFEEVHGEWSLDGGQSFRRPTAREWALLSRNLPLWHKAWPKREVGQ